MSKVYSIDDFVRFNNPLGICAPERDIDAIDDLLFESTVVPGVSVIPSDTIHQQTADSPVLTQTHNLTVSDARHTQVADSVGITQTHNLTVSDAAHALSSDTPTIAQTVILIVSKAYHRLTSDIPTIDTPGYKSRPIKIYVGGIWVEHYILTNESTWNTHNLNIYN